MRTKSRTGKKANPKGGAKQSGTSAKNTPEKPQSESVTVARRVELSNLQNELLKILRDPKSTFEWSEYGLVGALLPFIKTTRQEVQEALRDMAYRAEPLVDEGKCYHWRAVGVPRQPVPAKGKYPIMLEPDLEDLASHLNSGARRRLASKFQRWAAQLFLSAQLIATMEGETPDNFDLDDIICTKDESDKLNGKTIAEGLLELARLEKRCCDIRDGFARAFIVQSDLKQLARERFIFPN